MEAKQWDKHAKKYLETIISPFADKNSANVIFDLVKKYSGRKKICADFGCGTGFLLKKFSCKKLYAIDFSEKMIEEAKKNNKAKNIVFEVTDLRKLNYKNKFDFATSINSVLLPSVNDVDKILKNIYDSLKKGGVFVATFPAMESILYQAMLVYEKQVKRNKKLAGQKTKKIIESWDYDFLLGFLEEKSGKQKIFYKFEVEYRLKKTGFRNFKIKKLERTWKTLDDRDINFPGKPGPWDWLAVAKK